MTKKIKAIATATRVEALFAADGLTAQRAIADAIAHGVHNGRYALVADAINYGIRRAANSKSALYAVWCSVVEEHYATHGVYDDETCGRAICNALKEQGLRGETADSTATKCRAWLSAAIKAENAKRKAAKEALAAAEAAREAVLKAAAELVAAEQAEAEEIAARRAAAIDSTCVEVLESVPALTVIKAEKQPRESRVQKDNNAPTKGEPKADAPKAVRKSRTKKVA